MKQLPRLILALSLPLAVMADNFIFSSKKNQRDCDPCVEEQQTPTATQTRPKSPASVPDTGQKSGYWVQIGAFKSPKRAQARIQSAERSGWSAREIRTDGLIRVVIGPFENQRDAKSTLRSVRSLDKGAFIRSGF